MPRPPKPPKYRRRTIRGKTVAYCTFTDPATNRRRDVWLGPYGSPESQERYARVLAELQSGSVAVHDVARQTRSVGGPTVTQLCDAFRRSEIDRFSQGESANYDLAIRLFRRLCGNLPAQSVGPNRLRDVRTAMIELGWSRGYCNKQTNRIRRIYKWGVSHETCSVESYQRLATIEPLRRGQTEAHDNPPVRPVPDEAIDAVLPHVSRQVAAMIELQRLTGMRPGEVCGMRPVDLDMSEAIWVFRPETHKTAWCGRTRVVHLGPKAQAVIRSFLAGRSTTAHLFSPAEAEIERRAAMHAARKTPMSCGNRPGICRKDHPRWKAGDRYTTPSYLRAIQYACDKAFPPPDPLAKRDGETKAQWQARLTLKQKQELKAWRKAHRWHPHQLRHNAATLIRREFGLEAARILLGHSSAVVTEAVYVDRDEQLALRVAGTRG
ncbi:MAG: tyrosine recombinase XerC [Phycisphaerae bacterium]